MAPRPTRHRRSPTARIARCLLLVALALAPELIHAQSIRLDSDCLVRFRDGSVTVSVTVSNSGDLALRDLRVTSELAGIEATGDAIDRLDPGQARTTDIRYSSPPEIPGTYAVPITIRYLSTSGIAGSWIEIRPVTLDLAEPQLADPFRLIIESDPVRRTGRLRVTAVPRIPDPPTDCRVQLYLPDGLTAHPAAERANWNMGEESSLTFRIENQSVAAPSIFGVLAVVTYTQDGTPRCVMQDGRVETLGPRALCGPLPAWLAVAGILVGVFLVLQRRPAGGGKVLSKSWIAEIAVLVAAFLFTSYYLPLRYLLIDSTPTGGDSPAHLYLASHLQAQLFEHGRIISWAPGWWCGFPMFQYYFCLPYIAMAVLGAIIPFNVAFKLVSVSGILLGPLCAYVAARLMRLPRPTPVLIAIAMLLLIFVPVDVQKMWGVNIPSTLAGMIANSISFPIMLLFLGSAYRDAIDGRPRLCTALLLAATTASHFFTTLIACLALLPLPLFVARGQRLRAALALAAIAVLGFLPMAWWLVPLIAKQSFCVDFGLPWSVSLLTHHPVYARALLPFALLSPWIALRRRCAATGLFIWFTLLSLALYAYGFDTINAVFVNIRLWPFIYFGTLACAAMTIGHLLSHTRASHIAVIALFVLALLAIDRSKQISRDWTRWNYEGLEAKRYWSTLDQFLGRLDGTPGRLANDLHEENDALGSTRVFESVPHLIDKPILEGGIVNSALGSLFSYYVQCETSDNCAGYPPIVTPPRYNIEHATRHLELFNVKHFIARSVRTREDLAHSPDWDLLMTRQGWDLFELNTHDGSTITIPQNMPIAVSTPNWKTNALEWIYTFEAIDQPFAFIEAGADPPSDFQVVLSEDDYRTYLGTLRSRPAGSGPLAVRTDVPANAIMEEEITEDRITFRTRAIGLPHIIKVTAFPNWQVRGADRIYTVSPAFMLVYPREETVVLTYGSTTADRAGHALTVVGLALLAALGIHGWRTRRHMPAKQSNRRSGS